jgi:UDP-glucose 4-epimerase
VVSGKQPLVEKVMNILVTGGAGYIGSITTQKILKITSLKPIILDNLERGNKGAVKLLKCPLIRVDLRDKDSLTKELLKLKISAVIHFAGYCAAGESMLKPWEYFANNVIGSLNLFQSMQELNIKKIIFSSSCSIYGTPQDLPVDEESPENPESPYAESKRMVEKMLKWYAETYGFTAIALRYFNACGALMDGSMGEFKQPSTNLIPVAMTSLLENKTFTIYGDNYPTPDGTCIRDYIHVEDLADAHIKSLQKIDQIRGYHHLNLGVGKGFSVKEIISSIKEITQKEFPIEIGTRRPGDPAAIYADNAKAQNFLNWQPQLGLKEIIESAYLWHKNHPNGYANQKDKAVPIVEEKKS